VSARLMAVADVYDAFISRRVYKSPLTHEQALDLMAPERGRHFDPDILDGLLAIEKGFQQISQQFGDDDE